MLAAISNLTHFGLPAGLTHEKIEALVQGIRVANARLQAVTGESKLFANCFTVGLLVEKIEQKVRTRGCHHQARLPEGAQRYGFEAWLELERKLAVIQVQNTMAACHHRVITRQLRN